jgi:hypothetical protein
LICNPKTGDARLADEPAPVDEYASHQKEQNALLLMDQQADDYHVRFRNDLFRLPQF